MLKYFKSQSPTELSLIKNIQWIYKALLENELIYWERSAENAIDIFMNYPSGLCSVITHSQKVNQRDLCLSHFEKCQSKIKFCAIYKLILYPENESYLKQVEVLNFESIPKTPLLDQILVCVQKYMR